MPPGSNIESHASTVIDTSTRVIDADSAADDIIHFVTQPGFAGVHLTKGDDDDDEEHSTPLVPDPTPNHAEDQILPTAATLDQSPGPSGEPSRKRSRKTDHSTSLGSPERKIARFTPAISPERKTLCPLYPPPPNNPSTSLDSVFLYAVGSDRSHDDDVTSRDTPQLTAREESTWTNEVTTTSAGQTPYHFHSPPEEEEEEDIEVEEVPAASQPVDESLNDVGLMHRVINAIETLRQNVRDAKVDINAKYIKLRDVQDNIITKLIQLETRIRDAHIDTCMRLDAIRDEFRAAHLETLRRFDVQDRFIQRVARCFRF
ncbi:hypothetical protein R3I94_017880 [Phoxinus phoxinus]